MSQVSGSTVGAQQAELADANRILFEQGVLDAFGHVSVRSEDDPETFLLSRNLAPALVGPKDVQRFTLDAVTDDPRPPYLERFIHAEIYRARPDVMAVVHSHSPAVVPFSVSAIPLRPVLHMAGFLPQATPVFEIREVAGTGTDLLVRTAELGVALADALGRAPVALMRGHGSVAVGGTLPEAVYRAIYTEVNARAQAQALQLGGATFLTAEEGAAAAATNASQIDRAWTFWRDHARPAR
ncbi:class II aldolase/adducin family protein [Georgenia sp. AZ-5]|uniref:class II aldolase/adducin family protein n=1 Tax=Georgenia sp. AZ-5 TaxID=3367526 RepID=UPI0037547041